MNQSNFEQTSFGSRKQRFAKRKMRYTTLIGTGLAIFGTLFLVLLAVELYQANHDAKKSDEPPTQSAQNSQTAQNSQGSQTTQSNQNTQSVESPQSINTSQPEPTAAASKVPPSGLSEPAKESKKPETSAAFKNGQTTTQAQSPKAEATEQVKNQASPVQKTGEKPLVKRHVVQKGETLFKLARLYYGSNAGVERIVRYNGLDPNAQLPAGKAIMIPLGKP